MLGWRPLLRESLHRCFFDPSETLCLFMATVENFLHTLGMFFSLRHSGHLTHIVLKLAETVSLVHHFEHYDRLGLILIGH